MDIPGSGVKTEVAKVLRNQGFIRNYKFIKDDKQGVLRVYLKYGDTQQSAILGIERVSRPRRRIYLKADEVRPVLNGMGIAILSTSKGVMADKQARQEKIGGELLCRVW